jgi:hypothetical protein
MAREARTPGGTVIRNKPIMIFLHPNTEQCVTDTLGFLILPAVLEAFDHPRGLLDGAGTTRVRGHRCWSTSARSRATTT